MGYLKMKTKTKEKSIKSKEQKIRIGLSIIFSIISLGLGIIIAYFGYGESYIEKELITAIIALFGFGLSSTVFIYQAFKDKESKDIDKVIKAMANTLSLTFYLIIGALIFDFLSGVDLSNKIKLIFKSLKYATLVYSMIGQIDILRSFVIIIKNK